MFNFDWLFRVFRKKTAKKMYSFFIWKSLGFLDAIAATEYIYRGL